MQVLFQDNISSTSASSEDSEYPVENIADEHPKRRWQPASGNTGSLYFTVTNGSSSLDANAVAVFGTNATSINVGLYSNSGYSTLVESVSTTTTDSYSALTLGSGFTDDNLSKWVNYPFEEDNYTDLTHYIKIDFTAPSGQTLYVGVVRIGLVKNFPDPEYGLSESLKDYSISKELNNGAFYYNKRNLVRTFSGSITVERDNDFYEFMKAVAYARGSAPLPWLISTALNSTNRWGVYARLESMPSGSHAYYKHSKIGFSLTEVV